MNAITEQTEMLFHRFALSMLCVAAAGCTPVLPPLTSSTKEGPIVFTQSLMQHTSTQLDKLMVRWEIADKKEETAEYKYWKGVWCPRAQGVYNALDAALRLNRYCVEHGGRDDLGACLVGNPAKMLFYANITPVGGCTGGVSSVTAVILEPKPGMESSATYILKAKALGWVPRETRAATEEAAAQQERARVQREEDRCARELPKLTTRGTQICRMNGGITYVGFVDDVSADRRKIRILVNSTVEGVAPGGWHPGPIWDKLENWHVCE
ncbi:MAG: hypothetical protein ABJA60_02120 [Nitrosospira sp.]